ncbi:unnamed protein product [Ectocarpus fasciculatus]
MEGDYPGSGSAVPGPIRNSFVNALIVALNQIEMCDGGSWYTSTKELLLVSLEVCMACRTHQTMHLTIDPNIPRRLLAAADASPPYPKRVGDARVPRLKARRVTWNMPTAELWTNPIFALTDVDSLKFGSAFEGSLDAVAWPRRLKKIEFRISSKFNQPIDMVDWPHSLQTLEFGLKFNQPIKRVQFPTSLKRLVFDSGFDQQIDGGFLPSSLQELALGEDFNQPIEDVAWPLSLRELCFGRFFNQPIERVRFPSSLQQLRFTPFCQFNQPIEGVLWPSSLKELIFEVEAGFNQPIERVVWPASLQQLTLRGAFDQPIEGVQWPDSLQGLLFGACFNQPIDDVKWPSSMHELTFGGCCTDEVHDEEDMIFMSSSFNQPIGSSVWPTSLRRLTLGESFRQSLQGLGTWMPNLEAFRLFEHVPDGNSLLRGIEWPKGLRQLTVCDGICLDGVVFPPSVEVVYPHVRFC